MSIVDGLVGKKVWYSLRTESVITSHRTVSGVDIFSGSCFLMSYTEESFEEAQGVDASC